MKSNRLHPDGTMYAGPDLGNAARRSRIEASFIDSLSGFRNAVGIAADVVRYRGGMPASPKYTLSITNIRLHESDSPLTAVYAGDGSNSAWCHSTFSGKHDLIERHQFESLDEVTPVLGAAAAKANVVFTENIPPRRLQTDAERTLIVPAWVRQRVRITGDWEDLVGGLRRSTRQETARILRKYQYECRLTRSPDDFEQFFETQYRPYILRRHGPSALLVDRERFLRECRRGAVLQLWWRGSIVAGAVLRRIASTMAVLWSGMTTTPNSIDLHGRTDVLDYFSLLYANLSGCKWLDFGRSRPDLCDGTLRYKRKWGAEFTAGYVPQAMIRIAFSGQDATEFGYLCDHVFVTRKGRRFHVNVFVDGAMETLSAEKMWRDIVTPGIHDYRFVIFPPVKPEMVQAIRALGKNVSVVEANSVQAALVAAVR